MGPRHSKWDTRHTQNEKRKKDAVQMNLVPKQVAARCRSRSTWTFDVDAVIQNVSPGGDTNIFSPFLSLALPLLCQLKQGMKVVDSRSHPPHTHTQEVRQRKKTFRQVCSSSEPRLSLQPHYTKGEPARPHSWPSSHSALVNPKNKIKRFIVLLLLLQMC